MKKLLLSFIALIALLSGCNQSASASPEEIAKIAYEWEKAEFDNDYDKQQELLYEEGSYEVDKGAKKIESGLEYEDIRFEIYYDEELEHYYVFTNFDNPKGENAIQDELVFRKKNDIWKLDQNQSMKINREDIEQQFERESCIHCN
jgi:hypothetical protein